jgi:hypothetical protein
MLLLQNFNRKIFFFFRITVKNSDRLTNWLQFNSPHIADGWMVRRADWLLFCMLHSFPFWMPICLFICWNCLSCHSYGLRKKYCERFFPNQQQQRAVMEVISITFSHMCWSQFNDLQPRTQHRIILFHLTKCSRVNYLP